MKKYILLVVIALTAFKSFAQHTGYYDTTITFMGSAREIVFYAPANYNSDSQYHLMVMLHGLGDPVDDFASAMIGPSPNYWDIQTYVPNTIFVFPEVANLNNDFYSPTGAEQIVQTCIDIARGVYNIDTTNIVLEGFSIGGRDALRYGLSHYTQFKGLLLNTPAVQTILEALNQTSFNYEYNNASKIPIYITHGLADLQWEPNVDTVFKEIVLNNGIVRYFQYPGMGHSVPAFPGMNFLNFFDTATTTVGPNLDIAFILNPSSSCQTQIPLSCIIRNVGVDTITSFKFDYSLNGNAQTYSWNGTMGPFQHVEITLPVLTANANVGTQFINIDEDSVNSGMPENMPFLINEVYSINDSGSIYVKTQNTALPISTGFETGLPNNWYNPLDNNGNNWYVATNGNLGYGGSQKAVVAALLNMSNNEQIYLIMPSVDFEQSSGDSLNYILDFYEAYAQQTAANHDKLEVVYSTDCGDTWTSVWNSAGSSLATVSPEQVDYSTGTGIFIPSDNSQWKEESVNLNSVPSNAMMAFRATCEGGNTMFIDNVNLSNVPLDIKQVSSSKCNIYPNPATDQVNIESPYGDPIKEVNIKNAVGQNVATISNAVQNNELTVNTTNYENGIYFFEIVTQSSTSCHKIVINK